MVQLLTDGTLKEIQRDMGDGALYTTKNLSLFHTYSKAGNYTIYAIATDTSNKKAEASASIYIGQGSNQQYALSIQPGFSFRGSEKEYSFQAISKGTLDRIVRTFNNTDTTETPANLAVRKTFASEGNYVIHAKAYYQNTLKAIASTTLQHSSISTYSSLSFENTALQSPLKVTTNLVGKKLQEMQTILRDRGDGETSSGRALTAEHQYRTSGLKNLQQIIFFTDGSKLTTIVTLSVIHPFTNTSFALNIYGTKLSYPQYQPLNLRLNLLPKTLTTPLHITTTFESSQSQTFSNTPLSSIMFPYSSTSAGNKTISALGTLNRCVSVFNQGTLSITTHDLCLNALLS
jgi:hypothetical protein